MEDLDQERLGTRFAARPHDAVPISDVPLRRAATVVGEVSAVRVVPRAGSPWLEVTLRDGTGSLVAIFTGRRQLRGITPGRAVLLDGVARHDRGRTVMLNPAYTLLADHDSA
jgi:RecG-like helicase